jgi:hypothetical protein
MYDFSEAIWGANIAGATAKDVARLFISVHAPVVFP